jgi:signal transduction histidine kinase
MIDLGPYAFKEMTYGAALERCIPVWQRRYGLRVSLRIDPGELPSQAGGDLFRITQEAVMNAVKHGRAGHVSISLRCDEERIDLSIVDDGHGFGDVDPFDITEPGHIGLASMRERAELLHGSLRIESTKEGTAVIVRAPRPPAAD